VNNSDLMIDLETLGTDPETPVVSLGATFFDPTTKQLGGTFYMILDVSEQIARGRKPTGDTIKWWMGQTDAAKKIFHEKAKPAKDVLNLFIQWFKATNSKAFVWGNGSTFDISIMEHIFRDYGLEKPWSHNKVMDLRTFKRFQGGGEQIKKSGVEHNALDDAISQAKYVVERS
jgi:hypothetical protein